MYSDIGRPSIPPEQLLRALLLQALYTIRSERLLMEEIDYSMLFRWFIGLSMDEPIWSPTTFSKNRDRLLKGDIAERVLRRRGRARRARPACCRTSTSPSTGRCSRRGRVSRAFSARTPARRRRPDDPGNPTVNFHGETRTNDTHASTTDPDAQLYRKGQGKEAKLAYLGHVLLDNRHGLVANVCATAATGTAEREAALLLLDDRARGRRRSAATRTSTSRSFVAGVRDAGDHAARGAEGPRQRDRRPHHAARRATRSANGNAN